MTKDLRAFPPKVQRRLTRVIEDLRSEPWPDNLDVKPLVALRPWRRVRDGNYRLFLRPLSEGELRDAGIYGASAGFLIARVVDKKDVARVMRALRRK